MMKKIFILLLNMVFLCACTTKTEIVREKKAPIPVLVTQLELKDVPSYVESIGTLKSAISVDIRPQIGGVLEQVLASEGDTIQMNAPLFKIDSQSYLIKLQEAEAQLAMDQSNLSAIQKKIERYKPLVQKNLVAHIEWDDLKSQEESSFALLKLRQATIKSIELDLNRCIIKAPIEGRLGKIDTYPGELIDAYSKPLVNICKLDPLIAEFTITEREFAKVFRSQGEAEIQLLCNRLDGDCSTFPTKITFLDNDFDPKTGLLLVRGVVQNPHFILRPGQSVRIRIPVVIQTDRKLIPQKAVRYNEQGPYVYAVQSDQTVALRPLILGDDFDNQVIVLQGLDESDLIVTDGHLRLFDGSKVEVKS